MDKSNLEILKTFNLNSLPTLDIAVLGALELFVENHPTKLNFGEKNSLIIGSEGAFSAGKIIFADKSTFFANQTNFEKILIQNPNLTQAIIISASGGKDSTAIAKKISDKIDTKLLTANENPPVGKFLKKENIIMFPKNREPYSYNVSPYLGMIIGQTDENPTEIGNFLQNEIANQIPKNLADFNSFIFILPDQFAEIKNLITIKFEELFGSKINVRAHAFSSIWHAKTIVPNKKELLINLSGQDLSDLEISNCLNLKTPSLVGFGTMFALTYFLIGKIQKANPPHFKENLIGYVKIISKFFGEEISPIVE